MVKKIENAHEKFIMKCALKGYMLATCSVD